MRFWKRKLNTTSQPEVAVKWASVQVTASPCLVRYGVAMPGLCTDGWFCSGRLAVTGGGGAWQGGRGLFRISTFFLKLGKKCKQILNSSILSLISGEMRISRIPTNPFLQTDTEVPVTQTPWDPPAVSMFLIPPLKVLIHPPTIPWPRLYYAPHHIDTPSAIPHPSQLIIPHPLARRWRK